jgi:L-alanine-DL-glutamate epimerase-like enolase superfamily enzyme
MPYFPFSGRSMRVTSCEIVRLRLPFRSAFRHAAAERDASDTILIVLEDDAGNLGFGEILARSYVTGESSDEIFASGAPAFAAALVGRRFASQRALVAFLLGELEAERWPPALFGGFEAALINLFEQAGAWDVSEVLGPRRVSQPGHCFTIGLETNEQLGRRAREACLAGATVVKVKVGGDDDVARLRLLSECWKGRMPIRLDANGSLSVDGAGELLAASADLPIESLEQPFPAEDPDLGDKLRDVHARSGVPLVADESVCRLAEARQWAGSGGYQYFNVRVGKCGGLVATAQIISVARASGIRLVGGSMVGESAVLRHGSELLLRHTEDLPYVEGLAQNRALLECEPVTVARTETSANGAGCGPTAVFRMNEDTRRRFLVGFSRVP